MREKIIQLNVFTLSILMMLSLFIPSTFAAASSDQNVNNVIGTEGYLPLGRHMVPTEIPNVYKVTDWLDAPKVETITQEIITKEKAPVYVAIVLDASGSMGSTDVYNSMTSSNISRYKALEYGVAAALQSLIDSGNKRVYVNISSHDGNNPLPNVGTLGSTIPGNRTGMPNSLDALAPAGQYFVSLYDGSGNVRPLLDPANLNTPAFVMTNWQNGRNVSTVPPHLVSSTGWSFWYNMNDFAVPFKRISGFFKEELVNGTIPQSSARYILAMGDGDDYGNNSSMISPSSAAWATSLKAPLDTNFKVGGSTTAAKTIFNADGGIGATIWGVTVGNATRHIATEYTAILNSPSTWSAAGWSNSYEPRMIGNTWDIPKNMQNSLPTLAPAVANFSDQVIDLYAGWYTANGVTNAKSSTHYAYSTYLTTPSGTPVAGNEPLMGFFADFGTSAADSAEVIEHKSTVETRGSDVTIIDRLNTDAFSYYQYPGQPMIGFLTNDPAATATPSDIEYTANIEQNSQIRWTLKRFSPGYRYTITYYVICKKPLSGNYYYPISTDAYVTYVDHTGTAVKKLFPEIYLNGAEYQSTSATNGATGFGFAGSSGSVLSSAGTGQSTTINANGSPIFSGTGTSGSSSSQGNSSGTGGASVSFSAATTPYQASVPNKTATNKTGTNKTKNKTGNQSGCAEEQIDEVATKKFLGKTIEMNTSKVPVYEFACKDAKTMLYLTKGKTFKIAGVTENYYKIQYKKKDGKVYAGYILKKDVKVRTQ